MLESSKVFEAFNINDFYNILKSLDFNLKPGEPIWFRGANNYSHNLIPTLYRESDNKFNEDGTYSQLSLREDYRYQNYKSRVYHNITSNPSNKLEWQALYQHHWGKTRMLDWSESASTALEFALEPFIDPRERIDIEVKRHNIDPCVWVLSPTKLNEIVYNVFSENIALYEKIFCDLPDADRSDIIKKFKDIFSEKNHKDVYFSSGLDISFDKIFSLCVIDDYRKRNLSRLPMMLKTGEYNPFIYLILRTYADAFPVFVDDSDAAKFKVLPPLAILHPYQSERIRAQRGAFTIFPVYQKSDKISYYKKKNKDIRAMDINEYLKECLYCIRLMDPEGIAKEILTTGSRHTMLYPDNEFFVHTLEAKSFHV